MSGFSKIGLHLDLRVQVPPMPALRRIVQEAAQLGVNTLLLEWEASFPFDRNAVISGPYAYTQDEVRDFLRDCDLRGLDVIPLQQCFGHVEYILRHDRYAGLREAENDLCQVCPCRGDEAVAVFTDLFREIVALHASPYFHIGGDETYLLGHCPECRSRVEKEGASRLYVDYLRRLAEAVIALGKRPMLWIDMLLKYPEAAAEMPRECVFIDWNYGWAVDRFGDFAGLSALPFEFWGAVAMRSAPDNHSSHAWKAHLDNLRDYVPVARAMNFPGIILTSWSTSGVYGYEWEMTGRALDLKPVRRVTPHVGLRVLLEAFAEAANRDDVLDAGEFLDRYGTDRFGLAGQEALDFREALLLGDQTSAPEGDSAKACRLMAALTPERHFEEFERCRLVLDLTEYDRRVSLLEARVQSDSYSLRTKGTIGQQAQALLMEGEALGERFGQLYEGELYPDELREESDYRLKRIRNLVRKTNGRHTVRPRSFRGLPMQGGTVRPDVQPTGRELADTTV